MRIAGFPLRLGTQERLQWLRRIDHAAPWSSLDDRRSCPLCERTFTGREVKIAGGTRNSGRLRLQCPTEGCISTMSDWIAAGPAAPTAGVRRLAPAERTSGSSSCIRVTHHGRAVTFHRPKPATATGDATSEFTASSVAGSTSAWMQWRQKSSAVLSELRPPASFGLMF
jgi:hypothetical protein